MPPGHNARMSDFPSVSDWLSALGRPSALAELGVLAAETGENASNIGLTGFLTAGLEYL